MRATESSQKTDHDPHAEGERCMWAGNFEGARAAAARMLARDPNSAEAIELLGRIAMQERKWDEAAGYLERAIGIDPLNRRGLELLTACYRLMGNGNKAADAKARLARLGGSGY